MYAAPVQDLTDLLAPIAADQRAIVVPLDSPGARWKVGVPTFIFARRCAVATAGLAYSMRVTTAQLSTQSSMVEVVEEPL